MLLKNLTIVLVFFLIFDFGASALAEENQQIGTLIKGLKKGSSISEKVRNPLGKITKRKIEELRKIAKILRNKPKIDEEYKRAVQVIFGIAKSRQENIAIRSHAFFALAGLTKIDNYPGLNQQRKELFINSVKGDESPSLRAEIIMAGDFSFLSFRKKEHKKYPEYFQTFKELFYDKNESYMVRASAAFTLAYFNKFSGEKKKAIETLFDIMRSIPERDIKYGSRSEGRVELSLKRLTGKDFQSREKWEEWYSGNK